MSEIITCAYCDNKATHRRSPDIDVKGVALCDNDNCYYNFCAIIFEAVCWKKILKKKTN